MDAYNAGQKAYYDGYNAQDVTKFYPDESPEAIQWLKGLNEARLTVEMFCIPRNLLGEKPEQSKLLLVDTMWYEFDDGGRCLVRVGGNPKRRADRVAMIEEYPSVRIRGYHERKVGQDLTLDPEILDNLNWANRTFPVQQPIDLHAQRWCELTLLMLGYEFDI